MGLGRLAASGRRAPACALARLMWCCQEIFTYVTAGEKRQVDILAETRLKGGPGLILVHVEPQACVQDDFSKQLFAV